MDNSTLIKQKIYVKGQQYTYKTKKYMFRVNSTLIKQKIYIHGQQYTYKTKKIYSGSTVHL